MRKGHSITGLQVLTAEGADLGKVIDLVFDHDADECVALVLRDSGFMKSGQVVPWSDINAIGKDAVIVKSEASIVNPQDHGRLRAIMERETHLSGTQILTEDGRNIGSFSEIFLDETTGKVLGYEVSGGFVADTMSGKRYISAARTDDLRVGNDVLLAPSAVGDDLERQASEEPGGLKGAYGSAREKVTDTYGNLAGASIEKQKEFVSGKTASREVFLPAPTSESALAKTEAQNGPLLVGSGQTITREHADQAESSGILHSLVLAAGGTFAGGLLEGAKEKFGGVTDKISGSAGEHGENLQEKAAQSAIGKPAGREVALASGATLVASGQIITSEILENARLYGKENEVIASAHLGATSQGAQNAYGGAKETAGGMFDSLKSKVAELTGTAHEKKADYDAANEQKAINRALGRPVTRVILAGDDTVILNTGDIITHKAVNLARENNVLDVLTASVYETDPEITPEMMRATQSGTAALEGQAQPTGQPITATVMPDQSAQPQPAQGELKNI